MAMSDERDAPPRARTASAGSIARDGARARRRRRSARGAVPGASRRVEAGVRAGPGARRHAGHRVHRVQLRRYSAGAAATSSSKRCGQRRARLAGGLEVVLDQLDLVEVDRSLARPPRPGSSAAGRSRPRRRRSPGPAAVSDQSIHAFARVRLRRVRDQRHAADLVAGALRRGSETSRSREAGVDVPDAVVAEHDRRRRPRRVRPSRPGAAPELVYCRMLRMQLLHVRHRLVLATQAQDLRVERGVGGAGAGRMRHRDLARERRVEQVVPRGRAPRRRAPRDRRCSSRSRARRRRRRSTTPSAPFCSSAIAAAFGEIVGLDQALRVGRHEPVRRAAPPDAELRRLGPGPQARQRLAGRQPDVAVGMPVCSWNASTMAWHQLLLGCTGRAAHRWVPQVPRTGRSCWP